MNILRFLMLAVLACSLAFPAAARTLPRAEQRLVGIWQDGKNPDNIIQFFPDHRVRIYLSREEGHASGTHWIDGHWRLRGHHLTMTLNMRSKGRMSRVKHFTLQFARGKLVVKSGRKVLGRQHRISKKTLQSHLW